MKVTAKIRLPGTWSTLSSLSIRRWSAHVFRVPGPARQRIRRAGDSTNDSGLPLDGDTAPSGGSRPYRAHRPKTEGAWSKSGRACPFSKRRSCRSRPGRDALRGRSSSGRLSPIAGDTLIPKDCVCCSESLTGSRDRDRTQTSWNSAAINPPTPLRGVAPSPRRPGKAVDPQRGVWKLDWAPLTGERFWERARPSAVTRRGAWFSLTTDPPRRWLETTGARMPSSRRKVRWRR